MIEFYSFSVNADKIDDDPRKLSSFFLLQKMPGIPYGCVRLVQRAWHMILK